MEKKALQTLPKDTNQKALEMMLPRDRSVILAAQSKRLHECSDDEMKQLILRIYNIIGLPPEKWVGHVSKDDSEETINEKRFLKQVLYSDLRKSLQATMEEVVEAFKSAASGLTKWDAKSKTGFDLGLYDKTFSFSYVAACVAEYKKHTIKIMQDFNTKKKQAEQFPDERVLSSEEQEEAQRELFDELILFIEKNKSFPFYYDWKRCFFEAEKRGLIADTNDEKLVFMEDVKAQLQEEAEMEGLRQGKSPTKVAKEILKNTLSENNLKYECRKRRLMVYLKTKYAF